MSKLKKSIALFSTSFLPYSQTFIYEEIQAHKRYTVDVFCKERKNEQRFPYESYFKPEGKLRELIYENIAYWPSFNRQMRRKNYALIHAHFGTGAVYALPYKLRHNIPLIATFHGHDIGTLISNDRYKPSNWRYAVYSKMILSKADLLLAVSTEMAEILCKLSKRPEAVRVFHIGVNLDKFEPINYESRIENNICQLVMIGRFTQKKGHQYALKAFKIAIQKGRKAHLHLIGDGELKQECIKYVHSNKLDSNVTFHGVLNSSEISLLLKRVDLLLAPSVVASNQDREGGPVVIKEANATAIPAVGTYHGGIPEIIEDGKTGYLVPERHVDSLANRMIDLIDHPKKRSAFGVAAREKMERDYDIRKQVQKLESLYDQVSRNK